MSDPMTVTRRRFVMTIVLGSMVAATVALACQLRLEALRGDRGASARLLYLPSGAYLKVASLGFDGLLANLIYLWSIQYYAQYTDVETRYQYLEKVYMEAGEDKTFVFEFQEVGSNDPWTWSSDVKAAN